MNVYLCINRSADFANGAILPQIIAEVTDGTLKDYPDKKKFLKIKYNRYALQSGKVDLWKKDDNEIYSNICSDDYGLIETIFSTEIIQSYNKNNTPVSFKLIRQMMFRGINVETCTSTCKKLLIVMSNKDSVITGFVINRNQCIHENYSLKISNRNELSDYCPIFSFKCTDGHQLISLTGETRYYFINKEDNKTNIKFPLIDPLEIVQIAILNYKSKNELDEHHRSIIESILSVEKSKFTEYANSMNVELSEAIDFVELTGQISDCINGITKNNKLIDEKIKEKLLYIDNSGILDKISTYDKLGEKQIISERSKMTAELIKLEKDRTQLNEKIQSINDEISKLANEKEKIEKDLSLMNDEKKQITDEVAKKIKDGEDKCATLLNEIDKFKSDYSSSLFSKFIDDVGKTLAIEKEKNDRANGILCQRYEYVKESENENTYYGLMVKLEKQLNSLINNKEIVKQLYPYVYSSLFTVRRTIVTGDPNGLFSNTISALISSKYADTVYADKNKMRETINTIKSCNGEIVRVHGALSVMNYESYYTISKYCPEKIIIFDCDDYELLKFAPPEIWNYSTLINLNRVSMMKEPDTFVRCDVSNIMKNAISNKVKKASTSDLLKNNQIRPSHQSVLSEATYGIDEYNENIFIEDLIVMMSNSDKKCKKYERCTIE